MAQGSWRERLPVILAATFSLGGALAFAVAMVARIVTGATHRGASGLEGVPAVALPAPCPRPLGLPLVLDLDGDGRSEVLRLCADGTWTAAGGAATRGALPVMPRYACEDPSHAPRLWVRAENDGPSGFYTLPSGALSPGDEPRGCAPGSSQGPCRGLVTRGTCTPPGAPAPDAPRFEHGYTLQHEGLWLAAGLRGSGRVPSPAVLAFDPANGHTRWERPLEGLDLRHGRRTGVPGTSAVTVQPPEALEVTGARVLVVYAVVEGHRVAMLDASTGEALWDVRAPLDRRGALGARRVLATSTEALLVTDGAVAVLDLATGMPRRAFVAPGQRGDL